MTARLILQTFLMLVVVAGFLFGFGGDWRWPQAWVLLAEMGTLGLIVGFWLQKYDPALLRQRMTSPFDNENHRDRLFLAGLLLALLGWLILMAVDARFYEWSRAPFIIELLGFFLIAASYWICALVFRYNSFAVPQVRLQEERGQRVVSTGPYAYVRHPMYTGAALFFFGVPLLLGSLVGLLAAPLFTAALATRALTEEDLLRRELPGYAAYMDKVRFRLIPGLF